jgi:hypothetical protein
VEIKLTPEEEQIVRKAAGDIANENGISVDQALRDLLVIGVNTWREMQLLAKLFNI